MRVISSRTALLTLTLTLTLGVSGCTVASNASASAGPRALERSTPESVGMSSERLTRLHDAMQELVDDGRLSGITRARPPGPADAGVLGFVRYEVGEGPRAPVN